MTMLKRFDLSWSMHRKYHEDGAYVEALEAQDKIHNLNYQLLRAKEELALTQRRTLQLQALMDEAYEDTWAAYSKCSRLDYQRSIATILAGIGWVGCIGTLIAIITGH